MTKAETGVAGPVVAEMAYRNDYIALRGQSKLADEAWQKNRCQRNWKQTGAGAPRCVGACQGQPFEGQPRGELKASYAKAESSRLRTLTTRQS